MLLVVATLAAVACAGGGDPQVAVDEVSWACSATRCTVSFRLTAHGESEALVVRVRAYAGSGVADRAIVGEYREMITLGAGQTRRMTATVSTEREANRVRVLVQRAN